MRPDILVFAPTSFGGLAEHVFYQVRALHRLGVTVLCLASRDFLAGRACPFPIERRLCAPGAADGLVLVRRFSQSASLVANELRLAWWVLKLRPKLVLLDSYVEYLSPLWIWPHILLGRILGVKYVANLHDPVRSYQIGPGWWHRLSVRLAYLPLKYVLVHDPPPVPAQVPERVKAVHVPVGIYDLHAVSRSRDAIRAEWGALPGHRVFLAFGYVRNGKNLDLAIRALAQVSEAFLVIAGSVASAKDRPFPFYRQLAAELGVADRVVLREGFVSDNDLADYFEGADFILLTYSSAFHSQSGVLNVAAQARKPVLASAAPSPLVSSVQDFRLGIAIEPDSPAAVVAGMRRLIDAPPEPRWEDYYEVASWVANARAILKLH